MPPPEEVPTVVADVTGVVAPPEGVAATVVDVVGLVLEHPAIATAITTSIIAMILIREIFKSTPS